MLSALPIQPLDATPLNANNPLPGRRVDEPRAAIFAEIAVQHVAARSWAAVSRHPSASTCLNSILSSLQPRDKGGGDIRVARQEPGVREREFGEDGGAAEGG